MRLEGRAALVTGASRGLGRALSAALAAEGMRVAMVARGEQALERAAEEIRAAGGAAFAIPGDVSDKWAAHGIAGAAAAVAGPIDLLVNGASQLGPTPLPLLLDTECEDLQRVLEANVVGPFRLAKIVAGAMLVRGGGAIVNVSSDAAVVPYPRWGAYGVSKAALDHLTRIWAAELEGAGVRMISVDPGEMDTQMHAEAVPDADRAALKRPETSAAQIVALLRRLESLPAGARVEASSVEIPAEVRP
ncbi:MAG TPA: SDR family oxidoreductase [bacterium]|nr:SDR family oxidoreductase [bacterium]